MSIQLYSSPMKYKDPNTGNYIDIIGISGNPGRGIASVELNNDYTLTITFTDGTSTTTNSIRGAQGVGIQSVEKTGTSGLVDTYTITFDDNTTSTFQVTNGASIDLHICAQGEYDATTRVPTIQSPDVRTFYLVPNEDPTAPNAYTEWLYADGTWERFGAQVIDLNGYATKTDTVLETTLSLGRKENSTIGINSIALGIEVEASGNYSFAEGVGSVARGQNSHAEGYQSQATNTGAHAEGSSIASGMYSHSENGVNAVGHQAIASGNFSHAEGGATNAIGTASHSEGWKTKSIGSYTHAEGLGTIASGKGSHTGGQYNIEDTYSSWPEWVASTSYAVGNKVKVTATVDNETTVTGYVCKTANSDAEFTAAKWTADSAMNFAEIIGNGSSSARSNARALDWDGNGHYMGDVYVRANADSSGGTMLPRDVQVNGVSIVSNGVANVPKAANNVLGVVKTELNYGVIVTSNGRIYVDGANSLVVKTATDRFRPVVPYQQHAAAFYGLAKAAGDTTQSQSANPVGTYTDEAKAAIKTMLGIVDGSTSTVSVTGTTPSITAVENTRYTCGEVSTLTITPPASGICIVRFTSGTTPTVLTATGVVWPTWFDATDLEADTIYEICITDGYGAVMSWAL